MLSCKSPDDRHRLRAIGDFRDELTVRHGNLVNTFEGEDPEGRDALLCENYLVIGEPAMRTIFTTGQVAKICKVAPRTVSKWFDSGRLRGYRIPGSQDRRIPREHLIRFLKEHGMPLGELEDEAMGKLLLVGVDHQVRGQILDLMPPEDYKIESAASGFEAGIQAESLHPDCVVIDFGMGRHEATLIAHNLRKNNEYADAVLVALLSDDDTASGFDRTPFNETFRKPFDAALLAERIRTLVGRKKQLA